jgi:hypothetical protein
MRLKHTHIQPSRQGVHKLEDQFQNVIDLFVESDSIDVCSKANINVPSGYLLSPNYPEVPLAYPPTRQQCRCVLRSAGTTDAKAVSSVRVRLLDVALTSPPLPGK